MSINITFVFGLLLASGWTQEQVLEPEKVSEPENGSESVKEASVDAKAEVNLGNKKVQDKLNKEVDENVEKTQNGVKASASASSSFNFNFEEFIAKLFEAVQQNKENNNEGESKNAEDVNAESKENKAEDMKSPFRVYARASTSASSSFYYKFDGAKDENDVQEELNENAEENELPSEEKSEVKEHCNEQNSEEKKPLADKPLVDVPLNDVPLVNESLADEPLVNEQQVLKFDEVEQ